MGTTDDEIKDLARKQASSTLTYLFSTLLTVAAVSRWGALGLRILAEMTHHSRRILTRGS